LLRGSQLDRSTLRQEFEHLHQAWPWSGLARVGPTPPQPVEPKLLRSGDPTDASYSRMLNENPTTANQWLGDLLSGRGATTPLELLIAGAPGWEAGIRSAQPAP